MGRVRYIEAGGTNYDIGFRIGECLREKLISHNKERQAFYRRFCRKHGFPLCKIEDKLYVVKAKPAAGAAFISLAYLGCLGGSSVALNEYGIAFSGNSLFE